MTAKETVGAILVLICGLIIFFGIQFLSNPGMIGGTTFLLSYAGIILIVVGIGIIVWFIRSQL